MAQLQIRGVDVSMLAEVEARGGEYRVDGSAMDLFDILVDHHVNTVRLRLWVDPYDVDGQPYLGGTNDLPTTLALARRAIDRGLKVMIDLHYSDFWTDPKKQAMPKSWQGLSVEELEEMVETYTRSVLEALIEAGVTPDSVQVGNEITNGMLWPVGKTPTYLFEERRFTDVEPRDHAAAFDALARLLSRGVKAVREVTPDTAVLLHLDFGGANDLYRGWFDEITARRVDHDVIALSYYPMWHGTLDDLSANLADLVDRYGKDVLVVETSYAHRLDGPAGTTTIFGPDLVAPGGFPVTVQGQHDFLVALMDRVVAVPAGRGLGIVYWEPGWLPVDGTSWASSAGMAYGNDVADPGNPWANQALFDYDGNALESWTAFHRFA
ncbi:arabinogalactan endo-beta-1,4-galactanase [Cellulosimicrobium cellulans]|uniref:glycoside hydrolase family 53 protein n=1 Tax=Cellulosimicrobium cellulans TaxID=1710 RepID=UPI0036E7A440